LIDSSTTEEPLASILTRGTGSWLQAEFGPSESFGPGAPEATTMAQWRFQLRPGLRDDPDGIGSRHTMTVLPNGTIADQSISGLGATEFVWWASGTTLTVRFTTLTGAQRTEVWSLQYDQESDTFQASNSVWGAGEWVRTEQAFQTDPGFGGAPSYEYQTVRTPDGVVTVDLPTEWSDVRSERVNGTVSFAASPSIDEFNQSLTTPGLLLFVMPSQGVTPGEVLEYLRIQTRSCFLTSVFPYTSAGEQPYSGGVYRYEACGGTLVSLLHFAASRPDTGLLVFGAIRMVTTADQEAAQRILASLEIGDTVGSAEGTPRRGNTLPVGHTLPV
jgi:hypothetical protein